MPKRAEDIFKRAAGMIAETSREREEKKKLMEEERRALIEQLGTEVTKRLEPALNAMVENASLSRQDLKEAISNLRIDTPQVPEIKIPEIRVPQPKVTVQAPEVRVPPMPAINIPETVFPDRMRVELEGIDRDRPLPALLVDVKGKPMQFGSSVGGGGKADFLTIKDIRGSTASIIDQIDGALKITGALSASLSLDYGEGEVGTNTARFVQATNAISSVAVKEIFGSTVTTSVLNGDNRVRVSVETGGSALTDSELRASSVPVAQASGAIWSTQVYDVFQTTVASNVINPDNRVKVELPSSSIPVSQVSGASWSTSVQNTVTVTGSLTSTVVVGDVVADAADSGSAPVKIGGVARTANPTAVAAGDRVSATYDDLGRQLMRPVQVRDLTATAYATLTNGTETTLRSAVAGSYLDLIYIMGANNSDAAVTVDIRPVTAGNIVMTLGIPAYGTAGVSLPVPIPQSDTGNNWTADMGDITGTTVYLSALFSQEI